MQRPVMRDYAATHRDFRWEVPETFNFGSDVVDHWAAERPDHPALIWCDATGREERYSFADIARLTDRLAASLRAAGIAKGDRVLVMLPRVPQWQIAMVAVLKLGALPIPCIEMLTEKDVAYRLAHAGVRGVIASQAQVEKFAGAEGLAVKIVVGETPGWTPMQAILEQPVADFEPTILAAEDPAILYYTSGSTGEPKGVTHAARALFAWRVSAWFWLDLQRDDVMWCTADTGWSKAGTSILFGPWSCGSTVVFHDGPFDPARRFEILERYGVTVFCASATELRRLLLEEVSSRDLSRLRLTVSAGEQVNPEVVAAWRRLTGVPLFDGYGQTETLMTVLNYPALPLKEGSMGKPLPGCDLLVLDESGQPLPAGEPGELALKLPNPQVMLGYWNDPERTASVEVEVEGARYIKTSDRVRRDQEGYFFHEGRSDDVINSAGYRIGPMEVENALASHPAVLESAAVASPDADRGEVVKAFVVLKPGEVASDDLVLALQQHCKQVTGPYKYPRRLAFVDSLPKTPTGKIRRRFLRDQEFAGRGQAR
ncbi:MAG: AMP-binding protein [Pseudomonadota bacterium]